MPSWLPWLSLSLGSRRTTSSSTWSTGPAQSQGLAMAAGLQPPLQSLLLSRWTRVPRRRWSKWWRQLQLKCLTISRRSETSTRLPTTRQYFYLKLPGGLWTATNKGVPTDCAACLNRRMTEDFCIRYGFPRKKSFMFSVYGEYSAVQLATEWTRRGNLFSPCG